ncbi:interferon-induced very large GTPase 1-like [Protopterus annectens]|uniref:interferon-induced very large GTPase 1-like n=1 Tax=Protopterus annectens TaxID=7888 RepID=UPI001CFBC9AE|nr:interferon-induced very large GTPase 1-like [Protopterus annectens]
MDTTTYNHKMLTILADKLNYRKVSKSEVLKSFKRIDSTLMELVRNYAISGEEFEFMQVDSPELDEKEAAQADENICCDKETNTPAWNIRLRDNDKAKEKSESLSDISLDRHTWNSHADEVLTQLDLIHYCKIKLSLRNVLEISAESLEGRAPESLKHLPWYFLRKIMRSDSSAVNIKCSFNNAIENHVWELESENIFTTSDFSTFSWIHPLDVIVSVFLCSDALLQQELMVKIASCQLALPLLLPTWNNSCTFLLWALHSVIKKWNPIGGTGFKEECVVSLKFPTFSFLRIGNISLSKSKTLNDLLSSKQQYQNIFIHHQMDSADLPRKISEGLAEITWYLPCDSESIDVFTQPFQIINLRGDGQTAPEQVKFLTQVSSAVFVFLADITESKLRYLQDFAQGNAQLYLVLTSDVTSESSRNLLMTFAKKFCLLKKHVIIKHKENDCSFTEKLQFTLQSAVDQCDQGNILCLEDMISVARHCNIHIDEDDDKIKSTKKLSENIIDFIKYEDISQFKCSNFSFQGETCKKLSNIEKEQSRLKNCSGNVECYNTNLERTKSQLRQALLQKDLPEIMKSFIHNLTHLSGTERQLFLQWMKQKLDSQSRTKMSDLRSQYKSTYKALIKTKTEAEIKQKQTELKKINDELSTASLGLEHFMREVGQIYETLITEKVELFKGIPSNDILARKAAELLLDGLPLELLNGDAGTIPTRWVKAVLNQVSALVGEDKHVFVLTVLGVQSTGKSTLLNTMFGMQFAVSSGRCTKGAFMQLINITDSLQSQLGYDFLMIIDTEGLKAPELQSLTDTYEHDNELATLVIGLSDMTLLNMSMEHSSEMKDTLQIVLHAFIRMKEVGKKPICVFVHQNVGDISAYDQNLMAHKLLMDQLDEVTRAAAKMEKCEGKFNKFTDIMAFDTDTSKGYIAGLWHGCGPMASVSKGYSTSVFNLKKALFKTIQTCNKYKPTFNDFSKLIHDTWNAVKMENFIFSFKNSLAAEAYHHLTMEYADWDWEMRRAVQEWTMQAENRTEASETDIYRSLKAELDELGTERKTAALEHLEKYFNDNTEKAKLLVEYRQRFINSTENLAKDFIISASQRCKDAEVRKKSHKEIETLKASYKIKLEKCIFKKLEECKQHSSKLNDEQLLNFFNKMWDNEISSISFPQSKDINIEADMESCLRDYVPAMSAGVNKKMKEVKGKLYHFSGVKDIVINVINFIIAPVKNNTDKIMAQQKAVSVEEQCGMFVDSIVSQDRDYDPSDWYSLLHCIHKNITEQETDRFSYSSEFILEFRLLVCTSALPKFKDMHEKFAEKNDPLKLLAREREKYFCLFKELYKTNDISQTMAGTYAENFLKPAIIKAIEKRLGSDIVNDMKSSYPGGEFKTRMIFHVAIMYDLHIKNNFENYYDFICNSTFYEEKWLRDRTVQHCKKISNGQNNGHTRLFELANDILKMLVNMLRKEINDIKVKDEDINNVPVKFHCETVVAFFKKIKERVQSHLVIPSDMNTFASLTDPKCFLKYLETDIDKIQKDIEAEIDQWEVDTKIKSLLSSPTEVLYDTLAGCRKYCFWCGAPCECTEPGHVTHSTNYHRPQGVNRYRWEKSTKLVNEICTTLVASNCRFRNKDTNRQWVPYKDYKSVNDYYKSWDITPDTSLIGSSYWKAAFYKYNEQFAKEYKCLPGDVPSEWNFDWKVVCEDMEEIYNVSLDSLCVCK